VLDKPVGDRTDQFVDRDLLLALLRRLPTKQRAVIVLRHYEGLPDSEIALILRCSEVTVRSNAHRGLARLRELMKDAGA
jgi:RNA polymerase sigma factor (sigma-70 family)